MTSPYSEVAEELVARILTLIPVNPHIMHMNDPWDLFKVDGFNCDDLQPTMYQAGFALRKAKSQYMEPAKEPALQDREYY